MYGHYVVIDAMKTAVKVFRRVMEKREISRCHIDQKMERSCIGLIVVYERYNATRFAYMSVSVRLPVTSGLMRMFALFLIVVNDIKL